MCDSATQQGPVKPAYVRREAEGKYEGNVRRTYKGNVPRTYQGNVPRNVSGGTAHRMKAVTDDRGRARAECGHRIRRVAADTFTSFRAWLEHRGAVSRSGRTDED